MFPILSTFAHNMLTDLIIALIFWYGFVLLKKYYYPFFRTRATYVPGHAFVKTGSSARYTTYLLLDLVYPTCVRPRNFYKVLLIVITCLIGKTTYNWLGQIGYTNVFKFLLAVQLYFLFATEHRSTVNMRR